MEGDVETKKRRVVIEPTFIFGKIPLGNRLGLLHTIPDFLIPLFGEPPKWVWTGGSEVLRLIVFDIASPVFLSRLRIDIAILVWIVKMPYFTQHDD
ncbi:hypothetical protein E4U55_003790 [Claviceps digitariae]|nr:hypothetical protein E4U55_003790 [Claviceps digitariae]